MKTKIIIVSVLLLFIAACSSSGGTTDVTITSVTDADGDAIETTGTTGVNPTYIDVALSGEATLEDADITYACGDFTPTISSIEETDTANTYRITVEEAWRYALLECTVTIGSTASASIVGKSIEEASYVFTNSCAVSDDFNADSQECWPTMYIFDGEGGFSETTWTNLIDTLGVLTFNTADGSLDFINATDEIFAGFPVKAISVTDSGFSVVWRGTNITGFDTDFAGGGGARAGTLYIGESETELGDEVGSYFMFGLIYNAAVEDVPVCGVFYSAAGEEAVSLDPDCSDPTKDYHIRLVVDDTGTVTAQYKESADAEYADFPGGVGEFPTITDFSVFKYMRPVYMSGSTGDAVSIESIVTTGIAVEGQY